jgi:putative transcriptional regulator
MIRFRLKELLAEESFRRGTRVRLEDVAKATDIHRVTLSKMNSPTGYNTTTDNLDRLCHFFQCELHDLVVYVRSDVPESRKKPVRT